MSNTTQSLILIIGIIVAGLVTTTSCAKSFSRYGQEVQFSYTAEFVTYSEDTSKALAEFHLSHLFGVLQSPEYAEKYDINTEHAEGFGAIKLPTDHIQVQESVAEDGQRTIRYTASGLMLLHHKVAASALQNKPLKIHLPYRLDSAYKRLCTDPHHRSRDDYWYFNNLYREGCTEYQSMPYSQEVEINISSSQSNLDDPDPRFDLLRGDNGNGQLFSIYVIHGFEKNTLPRDGGRKRFNNLSHYLNERGFTKKEIRRHINRPYNRYTRSLVLNDGAEIEIKIHSLLVDTHIKSREKTFGKFLKKAFKNGDVVAYIGHSGLGNNLAIPLLENKVGKITFNDNKRQIFFFNTCFSYSHYLAPFEQIKSNNQLAIITCGLGLLFENSSLVLEKFINALLDPQVNNHSWRNILENMEAPLEGNSYLLNVGNL